MNCQGSPAIFTEHAITILFLCIFSLHKHHCTTKTMPHFLKIVLARGSGSLKKYDKKEMVTAAAGPDGALGDGSTFVYFDLSS